MSETPIHEDPDNDNKRQTGEHQIPEQQAQMTPPPQSPVTPAPQPYISYPGRIERQQKRGGFGCWVVGLMTIFLVFGLIIAGLFLPPFSLGDRLFESQFAMPDALNNGVRSNDSNLAIIFAPDDLGDEFGVRMNTAN